MELEVDLANTEEAKLPTPKPKEGFVTKEQEMMNLQRFLGDLVMIAEFKRPNWYPSIVPVDREFGIMTIFILRIILNEHLHKKHG